MSDPIRTTQEARLTTSITTAFVINGRQQYAKVEFTDGILPDEDFDDFSARVNAAAITHLSNVIDEYKDEFKEITA